MNSKTSILFLVVALAFGLLAVEASSIFARSPQFGKPQFFGQPPPPPPNGKQPPPPPPNGKQPPPPPPNGKQPPKGGDDKSQICNNGALTLADGTQVRNQPTCVATQMGQLPTVGKMVAAMVIEPQDQSTVKANEPIDVKISVLNLETGFFSDADTQYYVESQQLNNQGIIQGHCHVTVQKVDKNQQQPVDPQVFAFFEGLNDRAQNGVLSTTITNGLDRGLYRMCTMTSAFTHQPVIMPVAKRGSQDDCIRFNVE